jgi:hypothetical protein
MKDCGQRGDANASTLLAAEDAQSIQIGNCGGDHTEQSLAFAQSRQQVGGAPAGHDVRLNMHAVDQWNQRDTNRTRIFVFE